MGTLSPMTQIPNSGCHITSSSGICVCVAGSMIFLDRGSVRMRASRCAAALSAAGAEMFFEQGAFLRIQRAEGVRLNHLLELSMLVHEVARNSSLKRSNALRIQLFTVPRGSFKLAAISEWLRPSK